MTDEAPDPTAEPSGRIDGYREMAARIDRLEWALIDVLASLVSAHNLLNRGGREAAPSDEMFRVVLDGYRKSIDKGRAAVVDTTAPVEPGTTEIARLIAEGVHTGLRRAADSPAADRAWRAIQVMEHDEWWEVAKYAAAGIPMCRRCGRAEDELGGPCRPRPGEES